MSASSTGIPPLIERQLLSLDKQIRDVAFIRGAGRLILAACMLLGSCLLLDGWLDLPGAIRIGLLSVWAAMAGVLLWRGLIRPAFQPISFAALAALVERQFPELSERLTSLVELRGGDGDELAPGASTLMQDLLARQTVKALDRVTVDQAASHRGSFRAGMTAAVAVLFLVSPFGWNSDGYGLLWARFFVPWGNYGWGGAIDLKVLEGDQVVARGTDVDVHVTLTNRRNRKELGKDLATPIWLNWRDENGSSDSRRLDWDDESKQFLTTLPHVRQTLTYDVATTGAKSGIFRVDVSDPPSIAQLKMEIEPAAYTGLPAKTLTGVPGEIRVPEFSRIRLLVEFSAPVATAELKWPVISDDAPKSVIHPEQKVGVEHWIPLELAPDRQSGTANVTASLTGAYAIVAKNKLGLQNNEPSRTLTVIPDQPPEINLEGDDEPMLARPDDVIELNVDAKDDYGLTALELHTETSAGTKQVESVPAAERGQPHVQHKFVLDLTRFELTGGQAISYRIRAVDNRPHPNPHEVWTPLHTLVINTTLKQLPDREMAQAEQSLEDELSSLRTELNRNKADLADLHQQTEQEALDKQAETDKSERLDQLQNAQEKLVEKMWQLADRLAARRMTHDLAPQARQIAEGDLKTVQDRLEQSKNQTPRDQLEPLSQAIDNLGTADRQLRQLEGQLSDLNKLEQDLAELTRMAQHAERLADQLDRLDAKQKAAANQEVGHLQQSEDAKQRKQPGDQSVASNENKSQAGQPQNDAAQNQAKPAPADQKTPGDKSARTEERDETGVPKNLKDEANKLADQMSELLKKHPELLEAARREQLDRLNELAEQARKLAGPQERLAEALKEAAADAPALATRPDNAQTQQPQSTAPNPDGETKTATTEEPAGSNAPSTKDQPSGEKKNPDQPAAANPEEKNPDQIGPAKPKTSFDKPDPKASKEMPDAIPVSDQPKDQPQKPADATNPGDRGSNETANESTKNAEPNSSKPKQRGPNSDVPNQPDANAAASKKDQASPLADRPSNQSNTDASKPAADKPSVDGAKPNADGNKPGVDANKPNPDGNKPGADGNKPAEGATKPNADANKSASDHANNNPAAKGVPKEPQSGQKPSVNPAAESAQKAGSDAARQQEQIAREATRQALDLARETGSDSSATKAAADFARKADAAKQQAQTGQLAQAAKEAREAAKSAEDTARELNPDGQSTSPQSKQAQQLAQKQNAAAQQLENLAPSANAAQGAQVQGQKQLAEAASQLAEQLDRAAKSLKSTPLNSPKEGRSGEKASQATKQAEQAMKQAATANQQNDPRQAAQAATEAAEKLKQAANSVPPPPPKKPNSLPVPKDIASKVSEVTNRLENAQKELSQCNCQKPGESAKSSPNGKSSPNASQSSTSSQTQSSSSQQPTQSQSQSQLPSKPSESNSQSKPGQGEKPGQGQQDSKAQGQNPQNGNPQGQKSQGEKPGQGQQDSKAQGQNPQDGNQQGRKSQGEKQARGPKDPKAEGQSPKSDTAQGQKSSDATDPQSNVGPSQQVGPQQAPSQLAEVADQFREVAAMLRQARGEPKENLDAGQPMKSERHGSPMPGQVSQQSEPGESGSNASGTTATPDLGHLDAELQQLARHNWGRLPGQLRTEILQGAGKKSHPQYTQRIKSYFDEITKPAK